MADNDSQTSGQQKRSLLKWKGPAGLGIIGALVGFLGHLLLGWYTYRDTRELDNAKLQSQLILQSVNEPDLQQSCQNLLFFISTSLLKDRQGKITQECTRPLQQTYIPALAASAPTGVNSSDMGITVKETDHGSTDDYDVSFTVPTKPGRVFSTLKIYCTKLSGSKRVQEKLYPSKQGSWKSGDRVTFSVDVPKELADLQAGWNLTFCVGTESACYPSPNLLILASQRDKPLQNMPSSTIQ